MFSFLKIDELSYLEECSSGSLTSRSRGGYANADAYTDTGPGYAFAVATAEVGGLSGATLTKTKTSIRQNKRFMFSRAFALGEAIAVTESGILRDVARSKSKYKHPIA